MEMSDMGVYVGEAMGGRVSDEDIAGFNDRRRLNCADIWLGRHLLADCRNANDMVQTIWFKTTLSSNTHKKID